MKRTLFFVLPLALGIAACDSDEGDALEPREAADAEELAEPALDGAPPAGHADRGKHLLSKLDADGDGSVSLAEAEPHWISRKFEKLDANADGNLSADELGALRGHGRHGGKGRKGRKGRKGHHEGPRKTPEEHAAKMLQRLDTDGDGAISLAEAGEHRIAEKFAKIDADGDGKVTADELVTFKREHRRDRRHHEVEGPVAG